MRKRISLNKALKRFSRIRIKSIMKQYDINCLIMSIYNAAAYRQEYKKDDDLGAIGVLDCGVFEDIERLKRLGYKDTDKLLDNYFGLHERRI